MWRKLCAQIDADFIPGKSLGFGKHDVIRAYHDNWVILIDTLQYPKQPIRTRFRAPYVNRDSFYFRIFRRKTFSNLQKAFGMQDIVIGFKQFDDDFIIQGNDERKLRMLFDNDLIRRLISWQPDISLWVDADDSWLTDEFGQGVNELRFEVFGLITDLQRLQDLYDLFAELLNHLCHIGSAYEDDPFLED
ncbi:MAG: DUF3137 domain-containing protein [Bacteroidota bacterium]